MQPYTYAVDIRIWHRSIDPESITAELGLKPNRTAKVGTARLTPKGHPLSGICRETYWNATPFERPEYLSIDDAVEDVLIDVLALLQPHAEFLKGLTASGGRVHLQVSSYSARNYAFEFSPTFLADCAATGVSLVHDVYPVVQGR